MFSWQSAVSIILNELIDGGGIARSTYLEVEGCFSLLFSFLQLLGKGPLVSSIDACARSKREREIDF